MRRWEKEDRLFKLISIGLPLVAVMLLASCSTQQTLIKDKFVIDNCLDTHYNIIGSNIKVEKQLIEGDLYRLLTKDHKESHICFDGKHLNTAIANVYIKFKVTIP